MKKTIIYICILIFLLLISRFIDFSIYSFLANKEYKSYGRGSEADIYYEYLGPSTFKMAESILLKKVKNIKNRFIIVSFYDLIHPLRLLVFNKGEKEELFLFTNFVEFETGLTKVSYYKFNRIKIESSQYLNWKYTTVMCSLYHYLLSNEAHRHEKYSLAYNSEIRKMYTVYFYIPLILMFVLYRKYNIKLAFLYFLIMPVLFFPKHFAFDSIYCCFGGIYFHYYIFDGSPITIQIIFFGLFLALWYLILKNIFFGIIEIVKKKKEIELKEKLIVLFFILLPIIFRI